MAEAVLDSSAIMAVVNREPGRDAVVPYLANAACSANSIAEVATLVAEKGLGRAKIEALLTTFDLDVHAVDRGLALDIGLLRPTIRAAGLSLGDRSCLALAAKLGLPAITADRAWAKIASEIGVEVRVIR